MFRKRVFVSPGVDEELEVSRLRALAERRNLDVSLVAEMAESVRSSITSIKQQAIRTAALGIAIDAVRTIEGRGYRIDLYLKSKPAQNPIRLRKSFGSWW